MFKKVKELLDNSSISKETAEALDTEIQKELKVVRDEAKDYRLKLKELQETFNEVSDSKKSLEEQVTGLDEKIAKAKEDGKKELVKDLEREKTEKNELVEKFNKLESTNKALRIDNSLNSALSSYDMLDSDLVSLAIKQSLSIVEGEVKFNDGKSLEDGIKAFFESKAHMLKSKGNAGSGSENNNQGSENLTDMEKAFQAKLNKFKG